MNTESNMSADWTPEQIREALAFSRNFATAKPDIGETEKLHIIGLCNLLERIAASDERGSVGGLTLAEMDGRLGECRHSWKNMKHAPRFDYCERCGTSRISHTPPAAAGASFDVALVADMLRRYSAIVTSDGFDAAGHYTDACIGEQIDALESSEAGAETVARATTAPSVNGWQVPPLDDESRWILGRPNFTVGHIARILRHAGHSIATKAEEEQATVIHWMLGIYAEHGATWRDVANAKLADMAAKESS